MAKLFLRTAQANKGKGYKMTLINAFELATQTENKLLGLEQQALFALTGGNMKAASDLRVIRQAQGVARRNRLRLGM